MNIYVAGSWKWSLKNWQFIFEDQELVSQPCSLRWPGRNMRETRRAELLGGVRWHRALICFLLSFLWLDRKNLENDLLIWRPICWSAGLGTQQTALTWYQGTWGSWGWWCCPGCSWWCCGRAAASPCCGTACTRPGPPAACCGTNLKKREKLGWAIINNN